MNSTTSAPAVVKATPRFTFFRQSGWMMMATVAGGAFMWAVHPLLQKPVDQVQLGAITEFLKSFIHDPLPKPVYGLFNALLSLLVIMSIPGTGLQTIFAQQAAAAIDDTSERQLRGTVRTVLAATALIWVIWVVAVFALRKNIISALNITDPAALWIIMLVGLPILWVPVLSGLLQGRQNFLLLGWMSILPGASRCFTVLLIVRILGAGLTGAVIAVLVGAIVPLVILLWRSSSDLRGPREPVPWVPWLRRVVPLTLGLGAITFVLQADMLVVRKFFPSQSGFYSAASIIGKALVLFTVPLAAVMFPKVVQSAARAERTDVLAQALGATALMGAGAALFCTIFPGLPLRLVYDSSYLVIKPVVPWFAWCMLPLTLSNVLINNLLARARFAVVPWLVILAGVYCGTLVLVARHLLAADQLTAFTTIVQVIGGFSLILLALLIYFTWRKK